MMIIIIIDVCFLNGQELMSRVRLWTLVRLEYNSRKLLVSILVGMYEGIPSAGRHIKKFISSFEIIA